MSQQQKPVKFSGVSDKNGFFSNYASYPVNLEDKVWPTAEHYFQARQFKDQSLDSELVKYKSASIAVRISRENSGKKRSDWDKVQDKIMYEVVKAKFSQHEILREKLLATGDSPIVQHSPDNDYWGDGGDGTGKNKLGKILMKVRKELGGGKRSNKRPRGR
ncbi:MAG: NADAR family protein [Limisphaerales bacterium]